jgi:hypothetical protein
MREAQRGAVESLRRVVLHADRGAAYGTRDGARLGLDERRRDDLDRTVRSAADLETSQTFPLTNVLRGLTGIGATLGAWLSGRGGHTWLREETSRLRTKI